MAREKIKRSSVGNDSEVEEDSQVSRGKCDWSLEGNKREEVVPSVPLRPGATSGCTLFFLAFSLHRDFQNFFREAELHLGLSPSLGKMERGEVTTVLPGAEAAPLSLSKPHGPLSPGVALSLHFMAWWHHAWSLGHGEPRSLRKRL